MKKVLLFLLIILPFCFLLGLYLLDKQYFLCPVDYQSGIVIRSDARGDGVFAAHRNGGRMHQGIDLCAEVGTPVRASRLGIVTAARHTCGMGNFVVIQHLGDTKTIYGHLSKIYVKKNQLVRQGQVIGAIGKTGNANHRNIQPHLHFEVRKKQIPQDPMQYLE